MNIDKLLLQIETHGFDQLLESIPQRDIKILKSLAKTVSSTVFITENQSKLLKKILTEHATILKNVDSDILLHLEESSWSRPFRKIDQTRKIFPSKDANGDPLLVIEFAFHSGIRKILNNLSKDLQDGLSNQNGRIYFTTLTEKNIVTVLETLSGFNFEIHESITDYYETIKSWKFPEICEKYNIRNISEGNLYTRLTSDVGDVVSLDRNILIDRRVRYNYFVDDNQSPEKSLKNSIIFRKDANVWIDSNQHSLVELMQTLKSLNRFPLLVVFDSFSPKDALANLTLLSEALENVEISEKIGIYFRLDNNDNLEFNQYISNKKYNYKLSEDSLVAGVASGKIPKFFIKSNWQPMTVLSIGHKIKNSKTAVYANCCDLLIEYTPTKSLIGNKNTWLP